RSEGMAGYASKGLHLDTSGCSQQIPTPFQHHLAMRIVFPCLIALVLASAPAIQAQQAPAADAPPIVVAQNQRRPVPVATPIPREEPKKRGMLERLFGGREKATPT